MRLRSWLLSFTRPAFLYLLSEITGIWELLPDPYFKARVTTSYLGADFSKSMPTETQRIRQGCMRRLALMLYLNKDWKPEYGGQFELWNETGTQRVKSVEPIFNRCLIFEVTDTSYHGLPVPVACPPGQTRNSFAVYYHTVTKAEDGKIKDHTSVYAPAALPARGLQRAQTGEEI